MEVVDVATLDLRLRVGEGDGDGVNRESVSIVRSERDGRGFRRVVVSSAIEPSFSPAAPDSLAGFSLPSSKTGR
jgi:hypothetical protein